MSERIFFSICLFTPQIGKARPGTRISFDLSHGWQEPKYLGHHRCFPGASVAAGLAEQMRLNPAPGIGDAGAPGRA